MKASEKPYSEYAVEVLNQLCKGAFFNTSCDGEDNTMTIAWGNIGFMWGKPVFTAMVRYSRHSYKLVESSKEFTVSFPLNGQLKEVLGVCGKESGRDGDKFEKCNLTKVAGVHVKSPMIEECDLHLECKVVYQQGMDAKTLQQDIIDAKYANGNYHELYYGEIVGIYEK